MICYLPVKNESYNDYKVISAPADPAAGYTRAYPKTIDANNEGMYVKMEINGAIQEVKL